MTAENHTLKRALTDPRIFSGIGNAYSDEILHARSVADEHAAALTDEEVERLFHFVRRTLQIWTDRLKANRQRVPGKSHCVPPRHGGARQVRKPCPSVGGAGSADRLCAQRGDYCARCQTGGRLLSDRALSRLLGQDWHRTLEEMEIRGAAEPLAAGLRLHGCGNTGLFQRWIRFNGVGALGTGLQLAVVAMLVRGAEVHYMWATAAGIEAAVLHNFWWHERWTGAIAPGPARRARSPSAQFHAANACISLVEAS